MNTIDVNQVLAQMRAMAADSRGAGAEAVGDDTPALDFGTVMKNSLDEVSDTQNRAREAATAFESGDSSVDLPEVMVALQKAQVSFQAITQVRNKLLSAYQEVMNMQV